MERLIGAILLKTIEDLDDPKHRLEVEEFLDSDWFEDLTWGLNLDPTTVRNRLRTGNYDHRDIRARYR